MLQFTLGFFFANKIKTKYDIFSFKGYVYNDALGLVGYWFIG